MKRRRDSLFTPPKRRRWGLLFVLPVILVVIGFGFFVNLAINRHITLEIQPVTIVNIPANLKGFGILHLSDLFGARFGQDQSAIKKALGHEAYEAVVMTGDMIGKRGEVAPLMEILKILRPEAVKYLIAGDEDPPFLAGDAPAAQPGEPDEPFSTALMRLKLGGVIYLDRPVKQVFQGQTLWFVPDSVYTLDLDQAERSLKERQDILNGLPDDDATKAGQLRLVAYRLNQLAATREAFGQMQKDEHLVLVAHAPPEPGTEEDIFKGGHNGPLSPALILAGHLNNGQARLPGLGPIYRHGPDGKIVWFPKDEGLSGLSSQYGVPIYTSPGMGSSSLWRYAPLRFFNPPGMTLITLTDRIVTKGLP